MRGDASHETFHQRSGPDVDEIGKHVDNRFAEERGELAPTLEQNDGVEDGSPATPLVLEQNICGLVT